MMMLELRQVSRSYGRGTATVHALREVSLSAGEGAMVAVMGPSGSGKSTLLTIAGTLEEPTSGEVLISGKPVAGMSCNAKARLRRRTIGYVFQADRVVVLRDGRVTDQSVPAPAPEPLLALGEGR